jgi:hypothetical protein
MDSPLIITRILFSRRAGRARRRAKGPGYFLKERQAPLRFFLQGGSLAFLVRRSLETTPSGGNFYREVEYGKLKYFTFSTSR